MDELKLKIYRMKSCRHNCFSSQRKFVYVCYIKIILKNIEYTDHKQKICNDLNISTMILRPESSFMKHISFSYVQHCRDRENYYKKRNEIRFISRLQQQEYLIIAADILLPPLLIKLGLKKSFVKALDRIGDCFAYLGEKFPHINDDKLKGGIFDGAEICIMS